MAGDPEQAAWVKKWRLALKSVANIVQQRAATKRRPRDIVFNSLVHLYAHEVRERGRGGGLHVTSRRVHWWQSSAEQKCGTFQAKAYTHGGRAPHAP